MPDYVCTHFICDECGSGLPCLLSIVHVKNIIPQPVNRCPVDQECTAPNWDIIHERGLELSCFFSYFSLSDAVETYTDKVFQK